MAGTTLGPADQRWGYAFGIDGVVSYAEARRRLGDMPERTFYKLLNTGVLRKGLRKRRWRRSGGIICARSLATYLASLES